jgi:hypothetical protein
MKSWTKYLIFNDLNRLPEMLGVCISGGLIYANFFANYHENYIIFEIKLV